MDSRSQGCDSMCKSRPMSMDSVAMRHSCRCRYLHRTMACWSLICCRSLSPPLEVAFVVLFWFRPLRRPIRSERSPSCRLERYWQRCFCRNACTWRNEEKSVCDIILQTFKFHRQLTLTWCARRLNPRQRRRLLDHINYQSILRPAPCRLKWLLWFERRHNEIEMRKDKCELLSIAWSRW